MGDIVATNGLIPATDSAAKSELLKERDYVPAVVKYVPNSPPLFSHSVSGSFPRPFSSHRSILPLFLSLGELLIPLPAGFAGSSLERASSPGATYPASQSWPLPSSTSRMLDNGH